MLAQFKSPQAFKIKGLLHFKCLENSCYKGKNRPFIDLQTKLRSSRLGNVATTNSGLNLFGWLGSMSFFFGLAFFLLPLDVNTIG
jgi:hypothetical protein